MSEIELQKRVATLEAQVAELEQKYKDVAYEYLNNMAKRIEDIRAEVLHRMSEVHQAVRTVVYEVQDNAQSVVAEARNKVNQASLSSENVNAVVEKLTDGSHVLVTRPASRAEYQSAIPVKQCR